MKVVVINGPNLNLLGTRQPEIYGSDTLDDLETRIGQWAAADGVQVDYLQTNDEGAIVSAIHSAGHGDGVIINPGAFTHTSRAIADAVASAPVPVVEVHISNVKTRERWRAESVLEGVVARTIFGRGINGYHDAMRLLQNLQTPPRTLRYGPHPENVADLRVPPGASAVVVLLHGGLWLRESGRDTIDTIATALFAQGFASLNVEYRRSGVGGSWPGSGHDVKLLLDFLPQIAQVTGFPVAVVGHSCGGYLALWLGGKVGPFPTVCLAPITDLSELAVEQGAASVPAREMLARGAPALVGSTGQVLAIHGTGDRVVPARQSVRLSDARVELLDDLGHFDVLDPAREHWQTLTGFLEAALG